MKNVGICGNLFINKHHCHLTLKNKLFYLGDVLDAKILRILRVLLFMGFVKWWWKILKCLIVKWFLLEFVKKQGEKISCMFFLWKRIEVSENVVRICLKILRFWYLVVKIDFLKIFLKMLENFPNQTSPISKAWRTFLLFMVSILIDG